MSLVDDVAEDIWNTEAFQIDYTKLRSANISADLPQFESSIRSAEITASTISRLMQSAMIFAECELDGFRQIAQRISTAALRLLGPDDDSVQDLFRLIQARLRNFPALLSRDGHASVPVRAPLTLQFEFIGAREHQTIIVGDGQEHVLSQFQLSSWKRLLSNESVTLTAPTSAGKSYVLLLYLVEKLKGGHNSSIAYVVPTRALINQVTDDVLEQLTRHGIHDVTVTSVPVDLGLDSEARIVYVLTQERLEALLIAYPDIAFDVVVVDEAQLISDGARGVLLESVIDRISAVSPAAQLVFSGPMINNPSYFGEVFGIERFEPSATQDSPVTQNLILLNYRENPPRVEVEASSADSGVIAAVPMPFSLRTDADKISYISFSFGRSGSTVVYAGGKAEAERIAIKIAQEMPLDQGVRDDLSELIDFVKRHVHRDYSLVGTLEKGVAFHYGHMPSLLRKELEEHLRPDESSSWCAQARFCME
jgi:DEAD/DEAH box helicase